MAILDDLDVGVVFPQYEIGNDPAVIKKRVHHLMQIYKWNSKEKPHCGVEHLLTKLHKQYHAFTATIQPGDLVIFDTCHVHYPSKLISGKRNMFWLYY